MDPLSTHLARIVEALATAIIGRTLADRARAALLLWLGNYVGRTARRFARLYDAWRAGTLAPPRPRAPRPCTPRPPAEAPPAPPARPAISRARGFLVHLVGARAAVSRNELDYLLNRPDTAEFLRAEPRAARLLRPLCRLLGTALTPELALPRRPRKPRQPRPAPPAEPVRYGKYPLHRSRNYTPGRIPDVKTKPA